MGDNFSKDDWYHVRSQADLVAVRLRAKGIRTLGFEPRPPVSHQQGRQFYLETRKTLPLEFTNLVTKYAGGWNFAWSLSTDERTFDVDGAPAEHGTADGFIGVSEQNTILAEYRRLQERIDEPSDATAFLYPLSFDISGDCLALRFDRTPSQVVALDHEMGYDLARGRVISHGFSEFVRAWATLGFPAWDEMVRWMPEGSEQLGDVPAHAWLGWLASPAAPGGAK